VNPTESIIERPSVGPIFKTESITIFLPWVHLLHVDLFPSLHPTLTLYFSSHTVTINASTDFLQYTLSLCGRGELAEMSATDDLKIRIEEQA